ncbi:uncharacterized protein LOC119396575 [Rhipicephalus sanguineus]|uniref:uncharacterized protein LOC119396575 n=1 Tax=Rhipicephalus sanguineus TaxID=34632 RepID=UPI0020C31531|nr:uncharacterized protein LOC119396575 [Rhipicephalus sanguineus]
MRGTVLRIAACSNVLLLKMTAIADALTMDDALSHKGESQLGQWCLTDSNCLTENSGCLAEICACKIGFALYGDRCIPEPRHRSFPKMYLMSIGCLLSILIFSMSLCFLYWKRKLDDRRNREVEDHSSASSIAPPLWSDTYSSDKPPAYEVAVNSSCFRSKLEAPAPSSWHAVPLSDNQARIAHVASAG